MLPAGVKSKLVRWMEDNRGLIIVFFVLPASFIFDSVLRVHRWLTIKAGAGPQKHDDRVKKIQDHVRFRQLKNRHCPSNKKSRRDF
jgi:delta24-sterol reductase